MRKKRNMKLEKFKGGIVSVKKCFFIDAERIICNIVFIIVDSIKSFIKTKSRSSLEHVMSLKGIFDNFGENVVFSKNQIKN